MTKYITLSLLFFTLTIPSYSLSAESNESESSAKISTNSNLIDTKFLSTGQDKTNEDFTLSKHYDKWIVHLEVTPHNNETKDTEKWLLNAFVEPLETDELKNLYHKPIVIAEYGLTIYFPHGMTPSKTPRRMYNLELLLSGLRGVYVNPETNEIDPAELHHLQQKPKDTLIVMVPRSFHKKNHKILHPFTKSRIDRAEWNTIRRIIYKAFGMMIQDLQKKTPKIQPDSPTKLVPTKQVEPKTQPELPKKLTPKKQIEPKATAKKSTLKRPLIDRFNDTESPLKRQKR